MQVYVSPIQGPLGTDDSASVFFTVNFPDNKPRPILATVTDTDSGSGSNMLATTIMPTQTDITLHVVNFGNPSGNWWATLAVWDGTGVGPST